MSLPTTEQTDDRCPDCWTVIPFRGDGNVSITTYTCGCGATLYPHADHPPVGEIGPRTWAWTGMLWALVLSEDAFDAALWA